MSDWQPIETAPGDADSHLLVWNGQFVTAAWFCDVDDGGWIDGLNEYDAGHPMNPQPTHWMPLPEPPKAAAGPNLGHSIKVR